MNEFTTTLPPASRRVEIPALLLDILDGLARLGRLRLERQKAERKPMADAVRLILDEKRQHDR